MKISIIGAGAWGTTLALLFSQNQHEVKIWAFEKPVVDEINRSHENRTFLPGIQLGESISATNDLADLSKADILVYAVPTQFLRKTVFKKISSNIIICASKGIEENSLCLPLEILKQELQSENLVALSGPNLSKEISQGLPAAAVMASNNVNAAKTSQQALNSERFRIYSSNDPVGVQLGGALKNVIAIAAGISDGLGLGNNAKSALMVRGIAEITRLGIALGARPETFMGLSGMGDLITTCSSQLSRNHFVGEQIAKGKRLEEILKGMKAVAEGVPTTKAAVALAKKHKVELPIAQEVHKVLFENKKPYEAIAALMTRQIKSE
jgi:glycerol-3-phosphate dehydrogenase (NAD(P)+)